MGEGGKEAIFLHVTCNYWSERRGSTCEDNDT